MTPNQFEIYTFHFKEAYTSSSGGLEDDVISISLLVSLVLQYYRNCFSEKPFWLFPFIFCPDFYERKCHFSDQISPGQYTLYMSKKVSYI